TAQSSGSTGCMRGNSLVPRCSISIPRDWWTSSRRRRAVSESRRRSRNCAGRPDQEGPMPQVSTQEFERLPLRVHDFLAGMPLHDVWAVDLPRIRSDITLDEFLRAAGSMPFTPSPVVRALLSVRFFVGRLLAWDREPDANVRDTFATRLTSTDLSKSLAT